MKPLYSRSLHLFFLLSIVGLCFLIVREERFSYNDFVQKTWSASIEKGSNHLRSDILNDFHQMDEYIRGIGSDFYDVNLDSLNLIKVEHKSIDTLLLNLDDQAKHFQEKQALKLSERLFLLRQKALSLNKNYTWQEPYPIPAFSVTDTSSRWLIHEHSTLSDNEFQHFISRTKAAIALLEKAIAGHYFRVSNPMYCGFTIFSPVINFSQLNYAIGDTIKADVYLSIYNKIKLINCELNGVSLLFEDNVAPFRIPLNSPGLYPLHIIASAKNPRTDSIVRCEKTFFVKVRE